jgi:3-oxoacyl-[acyl-carrier protein] reductase
MKKSIVLITGTSRGLGRYLAEYYLEKEFSVIGCSRSVSAQYRGNYRHFQVDVTDFESVVEMFDAIRREYGQLDALVNNAATSTATIVPLLRGSDIEDTFSVNALAPMFLSKEAVKLMMGKGGRIIFISSVHAVYSTAGTSTYASSKAAIEQFSRVLAREVSRYQVTSNVLSLSLVNGVGMADQLSETQQRDLVERTIVGRSIEKTDVTNALNFLLSNGSCRITGITLPVGGF